MSTASEIDPLPEPGEGSPPDVERLFREHNAALLRFISARIGSTQEAREIAQEAYVQLLRLGSPEAVGYLRAFLFKTAANLVTDRLRQRSRRGSVTTVADLDIVGFDSISPERRVAGEQAMAVLRAAVDELPPKCRQAFLLHRVHELRTDEIAARVGIGERMVRRYVARALEHVRARMDEAGAGITDMQP